MAPNSFSFSLVLMLTLSLAGRPRPARLLLVVTGAAPSSSPKTRGGGGGGGRGGRGGGGRGGRGGGGGGRGGGRLAGPPTPPAKAAKAPKAKPPLPALTSLTAPLSVTVLASDSPEPAPPPLWATFCGTVEGGWAGVAAAVCPLTGEVEALLPGAPGGVPPALALATYTTEARVVDEREEREGGRSADRLERLTLRARTAAALPTAVADGAAPAPSSSSSEPALGAREPGLIIFDGGSYSRGPLALVEEGEEEDGGEDMEEGSEATGEVRALLERLVTLEPARAARPAAVAAPAAPAAADAAEDDAGDSDADDTPLASTPDAGNPPPPSTISLLEACLAWGGGARLRVALTLQVGFDPDTGELDVTPLRLLTLREAWQCPADGAVAECAVAVPGGASRSPSSPPPTNGLAAFGGEWKAFDVCGHALDPVTAAAADAVGGTSAVASAHATYSTATTRQAWVVGGGAKGGRGGSSSAGDAGGAYILPGSLPLPFDAPSAPPLPAPGPAIVELVMLPPVSRGAEGDAAEGMDEGGGGSGPVGRGFLFSVSWAPRDGTVVGVAREYDAGGVLVEARCRSAVRADVAGGAM